MITELRNIRLQSKHQRPFLADVYYKANHQKKPIVVFSHGFKGFKDWGAFDLAARYFAARNFVFVKFNFSHNGTTVEQPTEFADLEAFGNNNFSIELDDLGVVMDWINSTDFPVDDAEANKEKLSLIGHSRGGGISILKAKEDHRVAQLITWASVNEFGKFWKQNEMEQLKKEGVIYTFNARTQQQMPVRWQMYEDYFTNKDRLHIPAAVKSLTIPFFIVHGIGDETVPFSAAVEMHQWNTKAELLLLEKCSHTFGAKHPMEGEQMPEDFMDVCDATIEFLNTQK